MAGPNSNFLDPLLSPTITDDGDAKPRRKNLNLIGFTVADNPDTESTDVTNTGGGGPGSVIALADHAAFRALSSAPADGTVIHFQDPIGTFVFEATTGAGQADDDATILKRTATSPGSNGRAYSVDGPILPTIASLRLAVSGKQSSVQVQTYTDAGDGGGGIFDYDPGDTTSLDDNGTVIVAGTRRYKRRFSGPVSVEWFGAKADLVSSDTGSITALDKTLTDATAAFTSAIEGMPILFIGPHPGTEASGTIAVKAPVVATYNSTTDLWHSVGHGFVAGDSVKFTTGSLPAGYDSSRRYYVIAAGLTADDFELSATYGGSVLDATTNGSGTITIACATVTGTSTLFTTELTEGMTVCYLDNSDTYPYAIRISKIRDNTHFEVDLPLPLNTLSGKTLYRGYTWQTTIDSVTSATELELADASPAGLNSAVFPLFRYIYGTDNLSAFQDAHDSGYGVIVPRKAYGIFGSIEISADSLDFRGGGWMRREYDVFLGAEPNLTETSVEGSVIFQFSRTEPVFVTTGAAYLKCSLRDLAFRGPGSGTSSVIDTTFGLTLFCNWTHLLAFNFNHGWDHTNTLEGKFVDVQAFACATGVYVGIGGGSNGVTNSTWYDSNVQGCGIAYQLENGSRLQFIGGTLQACTTILALYPKNYPSGLDGVTFKGQWYETYERAFDIQLNGIFHDVFWEDTEFAGAAVFEPVNAGQGVVDKAGFLRCIGDVRTVDASNVIVIGWETGATRMGTPPFTINNPDRVYGFFSQGSARGGLLYSYAGAATDRNVSTSIVTSFTPEWSDGMCRVLEVSGDVTIEVPTNAPTCTTLTMLLHKTATAVITMAAGYKGTFDDSGASGEKSIVTYFFDDTDWILVGQGPWV